MKFGVIIFSLMLLLAVEETKAQIPQGRLFVSMQPSGFGYIDYPSNTYVGISNIVARDVEVYGNNVYAAGDNIFVYDGASLQPIDTILNANARKISLQQDKLFVLSTTKPFLKVYSIQTGHTLDFSLDTNKVRPNAEEIIATNFLCYLLYPRSVLVVNVNIQDTIGYITTPSILPTLGYNTFMCDLGNKLYIHTDYATGAPRYSLFGFDQQSYTIDTVCYHEFIWGTMKLVPAGDKIYHLFDRSHYDLGDDSLYVIGNNGSYVVDYDSISTSIFIFGSTFAPVTFYIKYYSPSMSDSINIPGLIFDADFMTGPSAIDDNNIAAHQLTVFPNPATTFAQVHFKEESFVKEISLFDIDGKLVYRDLPNKKMQMFNLEFSTFSPGNYLISCKTTDGVFVGRVSLLRE